MWTLQNIGKILEINCDGTKSNYMALNNSVSSENNVWWKKPLIYKVEHLSFNRISDCSRLFILCRQNITQKYSPNQWPGRMHLV